ncbi:MAG: EFR1 family ferrodoxin [Lachnospiraceae bacterium]|nr:EFR1 family ferrodoxin [Lachnospiraceae bacterium]
MDRIYYFSGTGNCLMIARNLADGLGGAELVRISENTEIPAEVPEGRTVLVFPIYCGNAPVVVRELAEKLPLNADSRVYSIAVHGGHAVIGNPQIASILNRRGVNHYKLYEIETVHNGAFIAPLPDDTEIRAKLDASYKAAREIGEEIATDPAEPLPMADGIIEKVASNPMAQMVVFSFDPAKGYVDFFTEDNCSECGICVKVCPMGNITLENGGPVWHDKCQLCLACLQYCPNQNIQYVHNHVPDHTSVGKKRYHNPDVNIKELIN